MLALSTGLSGAADLEPRSQIHCALNVSLPSVRQLNMQPQALLFWQSVIIATNLNINLLMLDDRGHLQPWLAKRWRVDKNKREIIFDLNEHCRWSDGQRITAQHMSNGIRHLYQFPNAYIAGRDQIRAGSAVLTGTAPPDQLAIEVLSKYQLKIGYAHSPDLLLYALVSTAFTPRRSHTPTLAGRHISGLNAVTSGPFQVQNIGDQRLKLAINPYYCPGPRSNIDELNFHYHLDRRSEFSALVAGDIDFVFGHSMRSVSQTQVRAHSARAPLVSKKLKARRTYFLLLNQHHTALQQGAVKRAIRLAIDDDFLFSSAMFSLDATRPKSFSPHYSDYAPQTLSTDPRPYFARLEEAQRLMRQAGYSADKPLALDFPTLDDEVFSAASHALLGMLKGIYIQPKTRPYQSKKAYYQNHFQGTYDLALASYGESLLDPSDTLGMMLRLAAGPEALMSPLREAFEQSFRFTSRPARLHALEQVEIDLQRLGAVIPIARNTRQLIGQPWLDLGRYGSGHFWGIDNRRCEHMATAPVVEKTF